MTSPKFRLVKLGVCALLASVAIEAVSEVPGRLSFHGAVSYPMWVTSEDAVSPSNGRLRVDSFSAHDFRALEQYSERTRSAPREIRSHGESTSATCARYFGERPIDGRVIARTLKSLRETAEAIYDGRVVGLKQGFFNGQPATLLEVEVKDSIRPSAKYDVTRTLYVHYPQAEFSAGGTTFCAKSFYNGHKPAAGERVLIFAVGGPIDTESRLVYASASDLVFESGGTLFLPLTLREDIETVGLTSLKQIRELVRSEKHSREDK